MFKHDTANSFINAQEKNMLSFLQSIIKLQSPSTKEKEVAERVQKEMKTLGAKNVHFDTVGNVIGEFGSGRNCILLSAHMDTAGSGDVSKWSRDPFSGAMEDGKIFGRGAGDNKGALAAMVYAGKLWSEIFPNANYRVIVGGTVLEEDADGYGMKVLLDELQEKPKMVMIAKPTNGAIYRGHRGRMEVRIDIKGESCHASAPSKGRNPIYKGGEVLLALKKLAEKLKKDAFLGEATLAPTMISVDPNKFNTVPGMMTICVDRRLTMGETMDSALDEIKAALPFPEISVSCFRYRNKAWTGNEFEVEKYFPVWSIPENHPIVTIAQKAGKSAFGKELPIGKWTVSTDGVGSMGHHSIPTIGYGPGERRAVDDFQSISDLLDAVKYYAAFCCTAEASMKLC